MDSVQPNRELTKRFAQTIIEIYFDGIVRLDLRRRFTSEDLATLSSLGLGDSFAVITACNPNGVTVDDRFNHRAVEALETELSMGNRRFLRADGVSPDGEHRERGAAVCLPRTEALRVATRYEQAAIFWFEQGRCSIAWTRPGLVDHPLPASD